MRHQYRAARAGAAVRCCRRRTSFAPKGPAGRSDGFLQFLAGAEGDLLAGLDLHRFPSLRIAAHPRFAPLHLKNAKPDDTDFVALHEAADARIGDRLDPVRSSGQGACLFSRPPKWGQKQKKNSLSGILRRFVRYRGFRGFSLSTEEPRNWWCGFRATP